MTRQLVYHYYAFTQTEIGSLQHYDGIATYKSPILTGDDLVGLKQLIDFNNADKLIISSLTLLSDTQLP